MLLLNLCHISEFTSVFSLSPKFNLLLASWDLQCFNKLYKWVIIRPVNVNIKPQVKIFLSTWRQHLLNPGQDDVHTTCFSQSYDCDIASKIFIAFMVLQILHIFEQNHIFVLKQFPEEEKYFYNIIDVVNLWKNLALLIRKIVSLFVYLHFPITSPTFRKILCQFTANIFNIKAIFISTNVVLCCKYF